MFICLDFASGRTYVARDHLSWHINPIQYLIKRDALDVMSRPSGSLAAGLLHELK